MPATTFNQEPNAARSFFHGTQPLWKAFWLLYVGGHLLLGMLNSCGLAWWWMRQSPHAQANPVDGQMLLVLVGGGAAVLLAYFVWCALVVWRCSAQRPHAVWRWSARAVTGLHALCWLMALDALVYLYKSVG